jgi:FkbM family methyltransferase
MEAMNSFVRRVATFVRGRPALTRLALRLIPDVQRTVDFGPPLGKFVIRMRRHRSWWLRDPLTSEGDRPAVLKRFVRPGDVAYDVGANLGLFTRYLAGVCRAGHVVAFEPMTENLDLLRRNVALLDDEARGRVRIVDAALGDADGTETLQVDDVMSASAALDRVTGGQASYGRAAAGLAPRTETVRVARLDTLVFAAADPLPPPRLIKLDVEGAELMALNGAVRTLREHRPIMVVELHERPDVSAGVIDLLESLGYHVFGEVAEADGAGERNYRRVHAADARDATRPYALPHLIASCDLADVAERVPRE